MAFAKLFWHIPFVEAQNVLSHVNGSREECLTFELAYYKTWTRYKFWVVKVWVDKVESVNTREQSNTTILEARKEFICWHTVHFFLKKWGYTRRTPEMELIVPQFYYLWEQNQSDNKFKLLWNYTISCDFPDMLFSYIMKC